MSENPYATPESPVAVIDQSSEEEQIRRRHINVEASIRSLGTLFIVGAVLGGFSAFATISRLPDLTTSAKNTGYLIGSIAVPILLFVLGWRLRKLSKLATIFAGIIAALGLFLFPVGTIINLLILYTLFCKKGRYVVTPEYREIIRATPRVRYRTSMVTWALLIILIFLILFGGFIYVTAGS